MYSVQRAFNRIQLKRWDFSHAILLCQAKAKTSELLVTYANMLRFSQYMEQPQHYGHLHTIMNSRSVSNIIVVIDYKGSGARPFNCLFHGPNHSGTSFRPVLGPLQKSTTSLWSYSVSFPAWGQRLNIFSMTDLIDRNSFPASGGFLLLLEFAMPYRDSYYQI